MRLIALFFPVWLWSQSSVITQMEYASLLYKNPRGISCQKCHGAKGEGKLIAKYKETKKIKQNGKIVIIKIPREFRAPAISKLPFAKFKAALQKPLHGMPRYYLTESEIKALYFYLQQINLERK